MQIAGRVLLIGCCFNGGSNGFWSSPRSEKRGGNQEDDDFEDRFTLVENRGKFTSSDSITMIFSDLQRDEVKIYGDEYFAWQILNQFHPFVLMSEVVSQLTCEICILVENEVRFYKSNIRNLTCHCTLATGGWRCPSYRDILGEKENINDFIQIIETNHLWSPKPQKLRHHTLWSWRFPKGVSHDWRHRSQSL